MIYLVAGGAGGNGGQDVVLARDDGVRDSLTKMMATKEADSGMSGIFHNLGGKDFSLRTIAFLLVSSISILLIVGVSIGLICRVQVTNNPLTFLQDYLTCVLNELHIGTSTYTHNYEFSEKRDNIFIYTFINKVFHNYLLST